MLVTDRSFANFVFPFSFDRARFAELAEGVDSDTLSLKAGPAALWQRRRFPHDDLLRHVADYLNPPDGVKPTAYFWTLANSVLDSPNGLGLKPGMVTLCLRHRTGSAAVAADLPVSEVPGALPVRIETIDLALFRVGMGYLIVRTRLDSRVADDWFDFLNGFRFINRPGLVDLLFRRRTGKDRVEPFLPPLAVPSATGSDPGRLVLMHILSGLLRRLAPGSEPWWQEVFVPGQMVPFFSLYVQGVPDEEQPRVLYRVRKFFRTGQELVPSADDLRTDHPALLPYAQRMWFSLTLEGGGFVAFDPPETEFWSETMCNHLNEQYFLLFLLALHQRCTLISLSEQVCARWLQNDLQQEADRFGELRESLLEFTARGYFSQVMQRDNHHRCFKAWQRVFEVEQLYHEVTDEIRDLHGMLMLHKTDHIRNLSEQQRDFSERLGVGLGGAALLLGFPAITFDFLQTIGEESPVVARLAALGAVLLGGLLMLGYRLWERSRKSGSDREERP